MNLQETVLMQLRDLILRGEFAPDQRRTNRRARRAQPLGQLLLGQALARRELAAQDQVAQLHQHGLLQVHGRNVH